MGHKKRNKEKYRNLDPKTIYVENLPRTFVEHDVCSLFSSFAPPLRVFFNKNKGKSFAFVEFENEKIADSVLILAKNKYQEYDFKPAVLDPAIKEKHKSICENTELDEKVLFVENKTIGELNAMAPPMYINRLNASVDPESYARDQHEAIMHALEVVYLKRQKAINSEYGHCARCGILATKQCGNCFVFYCSEICQEIDWTLGKHEELCTENFRKNFSEGGFIPDLSVRQPLNQGRHQIGQRSTGKDRVLNGFSKESDRESEKPERRIREAEREKSNARNSFDDRGDRPRNGSRCDESDKERYSSGRSDKRFNRDRKDSREQRVERNGKESSPERRRDLPRRQSSPERRRDSPRRQSPPERRRNSPRRKSPPERRRDSPRRKSPPERRRDSPRRQSPPERRRDSPKRQSPPERTRVSPKKKSPPERRDSPRKRSPLPEKRRSSPPARRLEYDEEKQNVAAKPPEHVEVKKDVPKIREPEKLKTPGKSPKTLSVVGLVRESEDSYWVLEYKNLDAWQDLQNSVQEICENAPLARPEIGLICGCFYDDMWYRGKIVSVEPKIVVHYIDFGNTSQCESNIKKLPSHLIQRAGLAFLIKFDQGTPAKYTEKSLDGEQFSVEVVQETESFHLIRFVGEDYSAANIEEKKEPPKRISAQERLASLKPKRRHVWDSVQESIAGLLHIASGIGRNVYGCLIPETDEEAVLCFDEIGDLEVPEQPLTSAKRGDFILVSNGQHPTGRGEIICKAGDSYIVNLVDHGQCIKTQLVYKLPEKVKNFPEIGVKIKITEIFLKSFDVKYVQKEETYFFEITGPCEDNKWPCVLKTADDNCVKVASGLIAKWNSPVVPLSFAPVESGSLVTLSALCNLRTNYVKPASQEYSNILNNITERLSKYSTGQKCEEPPSVGQLVLARFEDDGCFYRALVESIKGELFLVRFIDYGNNQKTKLDDLMPMPRDLMEYPCIASRVNLKHVDKEINCPEASRYLSKLNNEEVQLILTYEGDEVILKEKLTGVVVNDVVQEKIAALRN